MPDNKLVDEFNKILDDSAASKERRLNHLMRTAWLGVFSLLWIGLAAMVMWGFPAAVLAVSIGLFYYAVQSLT